MLATSTTYVAHPQSSSLLARFVCLVAKFLIQNGGHRIFSKLISAQSGRAAREAKKVGWNEATTFVLVKESLTRYRSWWTSFFESFLTSEWVTEKTPFSRNISTITPTINKWTHKKCFV